MDLKMRTKTYIDAETGVVFENVSYLKLESQVKNEKKYHKTTKVKREFKDEYGGFVFKTDTKKSKRVDDSITNSDLAKILYVSTFINYDNVIQTDDKRNMNKNDLKEILGVNKNIFYAWYNKMVKLKVIVESDTKLSISNGYVIKGEISGKKRYNRVFINSIRDIYESNIGKKASTVGHIMRLLKYVNRYGNVLCWNPDEYDEEKVELMTIGQILPQLKEYKNNPKLFMDTIDQYRLSNGEPIIVFFSTKSESSKQYMMMNPSLTFSGKLDSMKSVRDIFKMLKNQRL